MKFSASLFEFSIQLTNIVACVKVRKVVLPPADPVTDIVIARSVALQIDSVEFNVNTGITYEPAAWVQIYALLIRAGDVIVGTSWDVEQIIYDTFNKKFVVSINGLRTFKLDIVAVIITVNVSAALFIAEYQLINIEIESKVIKLVLPLRDPVTVIV